MASGDLDSDSEKAIACFMAASSASKLGSSAVDGPAPEWLAFLSSSQALPVSAGMPALVDHDLLFPLAGGSLFVCTEGGLEVSGVGQAARNCFAGVPGIALRFGVVQIPAMERAIAC